MIKITFLLAIASLLSTVASANETIVLKDTRSYLEQDGRKILFGGAPVAIDGELLVKAGAFCSLKKFSRSSDEIFILPGSNHRMALPSVNTRVVHYRCDNKGNPA